MKLTELTEILPYLKDKRNLNYLLNLESNKFSKNPVERDAHIMFNNDRYKNASTDYRNWSAYCLKQLRKKFPYKVSNFSESKSLFESYKSQGAIQSLSELKPGMWITCLGNDAPVKGKRYAEYYTNGTSFGNAGESYQIYKIYEDADNSVSVDNGNGSFFLGQFRLSTIAEIEQKTILVRERKLSELNYQIGYHQSQIDKLVAERNNLTDVL